MTSNRATILDAFHSRYAPLKEAERHIEALLAGKNPSVIFIIGGGLGYLGTVISDRFPKAIRVSLQPCDDFEGYEVDTPTLKWHPSSEYSLYGTILKAVSGNRLGGGVAVLEWPPVVSRFSVEAEHIRTALKSILEQESSNAATTGYWASAWLRNSIRFVSAVTRTATVSVGSSPIVIACAGPSLIDSIRGISNIRSAITLWAVSSAIPALLRNGLTPDLTITTDPGFWNGAHQREAFAHGIPIAVTPSACIPSEILEGSTIVTLDTGLSFEKAAIEAAGIQCQRTKPSGSASGTALSLALSLTTGPVAMAGYDLAARELRDHANPYAFDILDDLPASRIAPSFSARSARLYDGFPIQEGRWRSSRPFSTYAATISTPSADEARVFRLGDSPVETPIKRGTLDDIVAVAKINSVRVRVCYSNLPAKHVHAAGIKTMLETLASRAFDQALATVTVREPLPYDAALFYKAVAPKASASFIANAARSEANEDELRAVDKAARKAIVSLSGIPA